ncbi:MAG: peptidylprolyl isomerase [Terriglobia bacterium]
MELRNRREFKNAKSADLKNAKVQNLQISHFHHAHFRKAAFVVVFVALVISCNLFSQVRKAVTTGSGVTTSSKAGSETKSPPQIPPSELAGLQAVFDTSMGQIIIQFHPEKAPNHTQYVAGLVKSGFYDGTTFHRVILRGIIQGGDPFSKDPSKKALYGSGGLKKLKPEFNDTPHKRGTVSAVLLPGDPNSAGSQFFICVSDQPQLDKQYTAWGYVVEGMEVVDKISELPADAKQLALERVEIKKATLRPIPPPVPIPFSTATKAEMKNYRVRLETSLGNILIELTPDIAPETCRNFLKLTQVGLFDGTAVHRVVPGFVIQGGDLGTRNSPPTPAQVKKFVINLQPEFSDQKHSRGVISMARAEALDSASTSFFICLADAPSLDGKYTTFGKVVEGIETVDKIASVPLDGEKPKERIELIRAMVEEIKK